VNFTLVGAICLFCNSTEQRCATLKNN